MFKKSLSKRFFRYDTLLAAGSNDFRSNVNTEYARERFLVHFHCRSLFHQSLSSESDKRAEFQGFSTLGST